MKHRIRAASLVVQDDRLLLIKSRTPHTGEICWIPPGGGLAGGESIFDCARRETFEEAGVAVDLDRGVYLSQFVDEYFDTHNFEVFILCNSFSGDLTTENNVGEPDAMDVLEAKFLSRQDMRDVVVYPEMLRDDFWDDLDRGFPEVGYLGVRRG